MLAKRIPDRNIWVIYAAILLLGIAYGLSIAVLAIHLDAHGIPKLAMGALASAFGVGIIALSVPAGYLVEKLGSKRILAFSLVGYASCVAMLPLLTTTTALGVARFFDGAFSAGIWVSAETALLARSDASNKGFVMSLYAMSIAIGYVVGPLLAIFIVEAASTSASFETSSVLALGAACVVLFAFDGGSKAPGIHGHDAADGPKPSSIATVLWRTKTSCFATFSYGYFQVSVVSFLPLFLVGSKHVPPSKTFLVTAFFAAGMLLSSAFVSRLGDRFGHLLVMTILAAIGGSMVASFVFLPSFAVMCLAVFVAGGTLGSISPVSLALQGVVVPRQDLGRANAFYNAAYAGGILSGPLVSGALFARYGGAAMLFHLAGLWALFVGFAIVYANDDPRRSRAQEAGADTRCLP